LTEKGLDLRGRNDPKREILPTPPLLLIRMGTGRKLLPSCSREWKIGKRRILALNLSEKKNMSKGRLPVSCKKTTISLASTKRFVFPMINYLIEPTADGYTLTVWEPAPITSNRVKPFLFKANYIISSPLEAFKLLKLVQGGKKAVRSPVPGQLAKALLMHQKVN
jgi:hypothetical protein